MRKRTVDAERLRAVGLRLGDAVVDPAIWPDILHQISGAVDAVGAALLQSDVRTSDVPHSPGVDEGYRSYFASGWNLRDIYAQRGVPLLLSGQKKVITEQDVLTPEELRRSEMYNELLVPHGLEWWAGVGFWADSALWGLSIQRSSQIGPFDAIEKRALAQLSQRLTETATLSKAVGQSVLLSVTNALGLIRQPALALDGMGFVLEVNAKAEKIFDDDIRVCNRRLMIRDQRAKFALDTLLDQLRATSDTVALHASPISVSRRAKRPVVIRILPVHGAARSPFLGARVLLVISDLEGKVRPHPELLSQVFGLSRAEANLAAIIAAGQSLEEAAAQLGIARETARNQLKAIFAKTETHRQGELVALLSRLSKS